MATRTQNRSATARSPQQLEDAPDAGAGVYAGDLRRLQDQGRELTHGLRELVSGLGARERRRVADEFAELEESSREHAEALQLLVEQLRGRRGRPRRESTVDPELVAAAPFAELVVLPAHRLRYFIRELSNTDALRRAHAFELVHDRRASALTAIEERLRRLGHPLGGPPAPPWGDYARTTMPALLERVRAGGPSVAASVYAWEWYHARRSAPLSAAKQVAGERACLELVELTSPRPPQPAEPLPGYTKLTAHPSMRARVRETMFALDVPTLLRVRAFEAATKNRAGFLKVIDRALAAHGVPERSGNTGGASAPA